MKVTLLVPELKVFTRAVTALGKIGEDLYFECCSNELSLRCVNSSRSAFATVFFSERFFENASGLDDSQNQSRFKLTARTCCKVFKPSVSLDKAVQKCQIKLDGVSNTLVVQFFQRHGIIRTYNLPIIDCESLEAVYSVKDSTNHLTIAAKVVSEILNNFRTTQVEVTMVLLDGECIFRNFIDDSDFSSIATHVPVSSNEFEIYNLSSESEVTFCQRDMRAAISFGESVNSPTSIHCGQAGKPLILAFADDTRFNAHFVLATLPLSNVKPKSDSALSKSANIRTSPISCSRPGNGLQTFENTQTADTQILPTSLNRTLIPALNAQARAVEAQSPIAICTTDSSGPPLKRLRSVLFSRVGDVFFNNLPPPSLTPALLENDDNGEDSGDGGDPTAWDSGDEVADAPAAIGATYLNKASCCLVGRTAVPHDAARLGWSRTVENGNSDNATLLVADSDEET